jgi:hypothetical protein
MEHWFEAGVGSPKAGLMLVPSDNDAPPPRRKQVFNDHAEEDAALKKREDDDRWVGQFIESLAGGLRRWRHNQM